MEDEQFKKKLLTEIDCVIINMDVYWTLGFFLGIMGSIYSKNDFPNY